MDIFQAKSQNIIHIILLKYEYFFFNFIFPQIHKETFNF